MRRAYSLSISMNHSGHCGRLVPVQRFPQLESLRVELFQFDDVVEVYLARSAQMADGRPVRVEPASVGQPSVGQKTNELDERHIVLSAVEYRRSSSISVVFSRLNVI